MARTEGQASDYKGAVVLIDDLLAAGAMLGERGDDANWFYRPRTARHHAFILSQINRKVAPLTTTVSISRP